MERLWGSQPSVQYHLFIRGLAMRNLIPAHEMVVLFFSCPNTWQNWLRQSCETHFLKDIIYWFKREHKQGEGQGGKQTLRWAGSRITWAKGKHWTDWATLSPRENHFFFFQAIPEEKSWSYVILIRFLMRPICHVHILIYLRFNSIMSDGSVIWGINQMIQ